MDLFIVAVGGAHAKLRRAVQVTKAELVTVGEDVDLDAAEVGIPVNIAPERSCEHSKGAVFVSEGETSILVIRSVKGKRMGESPDGATFELPGRRRHTRNAVFGFDLGFVDRDARELPGRLIVLERQSLYGIDLDVSAKVATQVDQVCSLLYDWWGSLVSTGVFRGRRKKENRARLSKFREGRLTRAAILALHPPRLLGNVGIRAGVAGVDRHDLEVVVFDDLAHRLNDCGIASLTSALRP